MFNKKTILIALIAMGVVAVAVAATLLGIRLGGSVTGDRPSLSTEGWATYVSQEAEFSFRYPDNMFEVQEKDLHGESGKAFQILLKYKHAAPSVPPAMAFTGATWDYTGGKVIGYQGFAVDEGGKYYVLTQEDHGDPIVISKLFNTGVGPTAVVDDKRSPATRLISLHRHAEKLLVNIPHEDYHGMLVERTILDLSVMDRQLFFGIIDTLRPSRNAAQQAVTLLADYQQRVRNLKSGTGGAATNAKSDTSADTQAAGYQVYRFGDLSIIFDSTTRKPSSFRPKVITPDELKEKANTYIVNVQDTAECSATDISSLYIVDGINNSGIYDHALIYINHYPFEGKVRTTFEAIPKDDCRYFIRNPDTQPLIGRFLEAYEEQYEEKDLVRFAVIIGGVINEDHPLAVERRSAKNNTWVKYINPDYGIQFAYKDAWTEPYIVEDKEKGEARIAFGPWTNWEGTPGRLYTLSVFVNKPNVKFALESEECPSQTSATVCQKFDPALEPEKARQIDMEDRDEVMKAFVREFKVNGMNAYASKASYAPGLNLVFVSGLHNGYRFAGGADDADFNAAIQSFKEDKAKQAAWYEERFAGYMTGDPIICPERMDIDTFPSRLVSYYAGYDLNGCEYEADTKKLEPYGFYPVPRCAGGLDEALGEQDYDILNGCLYYRDRRVFEENLFTKVIYGDFSEQYFLTKAPPDERKTMGETASEWFRFEYNGKLYIFLRGGAGCGGCAYDGPYLAIDLRTGKIETKDADLPYLPFNVFSPDRKKSITFDYGNNSVNESGVKNVTLSAFDFLTFAKKEIYAVPDDSSVLGMGMGVYLIDNAVTWLDDNHVRIQLYEGEGASEGVPVIDKQGVTNYEFTPQGEPIVLPVN